jgi:hypothetical protein
MKQRLLTVDKYAPKNTLLLDIHSVAPLEHSEVIA